MDSLELVKEFHTAFDHPVEKELKRPDVKTVKLRLKLILEEFSELVDATLSIQGMKSHKVASLLKDADKELDKLIEEDLDIDIIETADALGDIKYVVDGTALVFGIPLNDVFEEIHKSNMSKLDPITGKAIFDDNHKIQKGDKYFKPNINSILYEKKS